MVRQGSLEESQKLEEIEVSTCRDPGCISVDMFNCGGRVLLVELQCARLATYQGLSLHAIVQPFS